MKQLKVEFALYLPEGATDEEIQRQLDEVAESCRAVFAYRNISMGTWTWEER